MDPAGKFDDIIFNISNSNNNNSKISSLSNTFEKSLIELYGISVLGPYYAYQLFVSNFRNFLLTSIDLLLYWASRTLIVLFRVFYKTRNCANQLYIQPDIGIHSNQEFGHFKEFSITIFTNSTFGSDARPKEVISMMIIGVGSVCDDIIYHYLGMILNRSFPSPKARMFHSLRLEEEVKLVDHLNLDLLFPSNCVLKRSKP